MGTDGLPWQVTACPLRTTRADGREPSNMHRPSAALVKRRHNRRYQTELINRLAVKPKQSTEKLEFDNVSLVGAPAGWVSRVWSPFASFQGVVPG